MEYTAALKRSNHASDVFDSACGGSVNAHCTGTGILSDTAQRELNNELCIQESCAFFRAALSRAALRQPLPCSANCDVASVKLYICRLSRMGCSAAWAVKAGQAMVGLHTVTDGEYIYIYIYSTTNIVYIAAHHAVGGSAGEYAHAALGTLEGKNIAPTDSLYP